MTAGKLVQIVLTELKDENLSDAELWKIIKSVAQEHNVDLSKVKRFGSLL